MLKVDDILEILSIPLLGIIPEVKMSCGRPTLAIL